MVYQVHYIAFNSNETSELGLNRGGVAAFSLLEYGRPKGIGEVPYQLFLRDAIFWSELYCMWVLIMVGF
jgi:hypothetical protein